MNLEAKKDELRMSWNKKVSMREIAQFYEDKLRELDAKQTKLMEDVNRKEAEIDMKTRALNNTMEEAKDLIRELGEVIKQINDARDSVISPYQQINAHLEKLDESFNALQKVLGSLKEYLRRSILIQAVNHAEFEIFGRFVSSTIDWEIIQAEKLVMKDEQLKEKVFLSPAEDWVKADLESIGVEPSSSQIKYLAEVAFKRYKEFIEGELSFLNKVENKISPVLENGNIAVVFSDNSGNIDAKPIEANRQKGSTSND